jgi:hypothetical protein
MKVLSVYRCVVISYVGRCCVWMKIYLLILSSSNLYTCKIGPVTLQNVILQFLQFQLK